MTDPEAIAELTSRTDADKDPVVGPERLLQILKQRALVSRFASGGVYFAGQRVIPSGASLTEPGACYMCTRAGVASAEPVWPSTPGYTVYSGGASFVLLGPYDGVPYSLHSAARQVLKERAAIVAKEMDVANGPDKVALSDRHKQLILQMDKLGPEWPL